MSIASGRSRLKFLYRYFFICKTRLLLLFALLLGNTLLQLYNPRFIQSFIDSAKAGEGAGSLMKAAILFLALTFVRQMVAIVASFVTNDVSWKISNKLRLDLTERCLNYDLSFHRLHTPGEMVERIDGDAGKLNNFLSAFLLKVIGNVMLVFGIILAIFLIQPVMGAVTAVCSFAGIVLLHRMSRLGTATLHQYLAQSADTIGFLDERVSGREDIRAFRAESYVLASYYRKLRGLYRTRKRTGHLIGAVINAGDVTLAFILAANVLTMGMIFLHNGGLSIGTMFLVYYYTTILLIPLRNLVNEASDLQQANASLQRIGQLWTDSGETSRTGEGQLVGTDLSVRFDQVTYSYDGVNDVLHKVSFHLPAGKTLGIVGKTGSGKTTVTRLLFRLCEVREGAVSINGIDVREIDLTGLRKGIAFISQNVELFEGTLKDNITMFKEGIADSEILRIFEAMSISSWLHAHPDGLYRFIERDGNNVSAGEAQLIALARAFLKKPGIVIMDEAVSRMDPLTEKLVHQALDAFLQGRTAIIIAHRLSSVGQADYILTLHNGRVVEFGETKQLVQDPESEYAKVLKKGSAALA